MDFLECQLQILNNTGKANSLCAVPCDQNIVKPGARMKGAKQVYGLFEPSSYQIPDNRGSNMLRHCITETRRVAFLAADADIITLPCRGLKN